jgi:hypothetical protein
MATLLSKLAPTATETIRADHTRVMAAFHRYSIDAPVVVKQAVVRLACALIEVHAQLEEEIFYPEVPGSDLPLVGELASGHDRMRELIASLRGGAPGSKEYDELFMELMREVMHHVADEETRVLPHAERVLGPQLRELGARMTRRRLELMAPRAADFAAEQASGAVKAGLAAGAALAVVGGALLLQNRSKRGFRI